MSFVLFVANSIGTDNHKGHQEHEEQQATRVTDHDAPIYLAAKSRKRRKTVAKRIHSDKHACRSRCTLRYYDLRYSSSRFPEYAALPEKDARDEYHIRPDHTGD